MIVPRETAAAKDDRPLPSLPQAGDRGVGLRGRNSSAAPLLARSQFRINPDSAPLLPTGPPQSGKREGRETQSPA
jgi:hypothetical protein